MHTFNTSIDHIAVAARTLADGVLYIQESLGVDIPFGGVHQKNGTHNHLMQLGESMFLEVIAVNPQAPPVTAPRWFALDDPAIRASIEQKPRLLTWVVNSSDLGAATRAANFDCGNIADLQRGDLRWSFTLPADGRLHAAGMLPYLMQWNSATHPSAAMTDTGCQLIKLAISHPYPEWLDACLSSIAADSLIEVSNAAEGAVPVLTATIKTPSGVKTLSSSCD